MIETAARLAYSRCLEQEDRGREGKRERARASYRHRHKYMLICLHTYASMSIFIRISLFIYICIYIHIRINTYKQTCMFIHICICNVYVETQRRMKNNISKVHPSFNAGSTSKRVRLYAAPKWGLKKSHEHTDSAYWFQGPV